ncbi:trans-aconitate 2-methyltransferase [Allokutzneria oryzae]|uniref:Trans-aconitate 2-methyltransferase n=1 Tax=Allokutzneria oryzae TaxID=1378989 RepID=A0ABV6ABA7_9PSEU
MWDPAQYLAFADHRARPFHELVARIGAFEPRAVVDLGCGPGTLTTVLADRWPRARLEALDASAEMVEEARRRGVPAEVRDVAEWHPKPDTDVVVCNAVLQWVPGHVELLRGWLGQLPPSAWFAWQVPGNFDAPSHVLLRELAATPRWSDSLGEALRDEQPVLTAHEYACVLSDAGWQADVWETTYQQRLSGDDPVLNWIVGTALRPVRAALSDGDWAAFLAELAPQLRAAYPQSSDGSTWFPFRRVFAVGQKPG